MNKSNVIIFDQKDFIKIKESLGSSLMKFFIMMNFTIIFLIIK